MATILRHKIPMAFRLRRRAVNRLRHLAALREETLSQTVEDALEALATTSERVEREGKAQRAAMARGEA
jgi:predicted transcriptional regulator